MAKLSMCRVCLGKDIGLKCIIETHLQEMYESLVLMPFKTDDTRPIMVCYVCCARLQNCYELRRQCLRSEELFIELTCDEPSLVKHHEQYKKRLTHELNVVYLSTGALQLNADNDDIPTLDDVKIEQNDTKNIIEDALIENSVYDNSEADSDDDRLIMAEDEQSRDSTSQLSPMCSEQDVETSSNLKQHQLVQDKFKEVNKVTAADKTAATTTNEVTVTLDANKQLSRDTIKTRKKHQCDICNKQFSRKTDLNTHQRRHNGENPYTCDLCNKNFFCKRSLFRHMYTHTGEAPHRCDICQRQFFTKTDLNSHIRTHNGEKPYRCDQCNEEFAEKSSLKDHMNVHPIQKPHRCNQCNEEFAEKSSLKDHMKVHPIQKPHRCDVCSNQYSREIELVKHMRRHTGEKPFSCDVCNMSFAEKRYLRLHRRKHTGDKRHQCDICNRQYYTKGEVISHMRSHTGEKPFRCDLCNKQFPHRQSLTYHKRLVVCVPMQVPDKS